MAEADLSERAILATAAPDAARRKPHAVVIGAGFGGLAAAIRLGARGFRVTVLERLDAPGGRAYVFRQDGFTFDAGPTIVTAPFLFEELWAMAGGRLADDVDLRPLDPFYRVRFDDGSTLDCSPRAATMRAEIQRIAPDDVAGYERFLVEAEKNYEVGFEQLGDVPFSSWRDMARVVPKMARLGSHRSLHSSVARHVKDPRVRFALSFHPLFVGGNPFKVTSIYGLISHLERRWGVHFAMGGTGSLVRGMANLIARQGNEVRCNVEVDSIRIDGRTATGVRLQDGTELRADLVVSNADAAWTYGRLLGDQRRGRWSDRRIDSARYSMGVFVWYFGTRRTYPELPHHQILVGPRYRELLADIFEHKVLAPDMSIYLHRPTATDPSLAPAGCDAFYALVPVPHLDADIDWRERAEPFRRAIEARLGATVLPGFEREVVSSRVMTPLDFRDRLLSVKGAAFGLEPVLTQSAWFRPHNRSEDFERLYLVGAGTHPGAGLPGVLSSARILDKVVPDAARFH